MSRKLCFSFIVTIVALLAFNLVGFGQTAPVSGTVELQKADGTREPVAGALIEVYRTDIKAGAPSTKTGKKGDFAFAGFPFGGKFTFSVSATGCAPAIYPNIKAGQEKVLITLTPGDGSKYSEADARKGGIAPTGGQTGELTAEQKKQQAEYEANVKAVSEKNAKAQKANEIIAAAAAAAKAAYDAKDYDLAITKYQEGIDADPDFVGSAPTLNNNRSIALRMRAVGTRNKAIAMTDATEKIAELGKARKDIADSATGYLKAWQVLKNAPATDITDKANYEATKAATLSGSVETFRIAVLTEQVDPSVIETAKILIPEYVSAETDAAKKNGANLIYADLYRVSGDSANAIEAYKKILEGSPDNVDALAGAGLSLFNLGYEKNSDKALFQEGANYLQKFVSVAPDTHRYKKDAMDVLDNLKKEQNVTPQKTASPKRKT